MATSGSTNFTQTRNDICLDAFALIGRYGVGRTLASEDMDIAQRFLNKMVKAWSAKGLHLWAKEEGMLYLTPYVGEYSLANASTDAYFTLKSDEVVTKLDADLATSDTAVTVLSTTGMTVADKIGIVLDTGYIHWTTIATIPTSTTLTLTVGVTGAATSTNLVYTFTARAAKPLRILNARLVKGFDATTSTTQVEIPLTMMGYEPFRNISSITSSGDPNQACYLPKLDNGKFMVWPRPTSGAYRVQFTFERTIEDLDSPADNFDFPNEWLECLTYQLAVRLGPIFGKDKRVIQSIYPLASQMLENLLSWDNEITSVTLAPDTMQGYYD